MRTMYDAVNAANIPASAAMVAGYVDQIKLAPWSAADWARFPNAIKVQIVKKASSNFGHVLDVEPGDATPAEAPGWVRMRRAAGADPTVYCGYGKDGANWAAVQAEFTRQGVAQPHYWIARYDGVQQLPTLNGITAIAKQYAGDVAPGIDISVVADHWPGVDNQEETMALTQADAATIFWGTPFDGNANFAQYLKGHLAALEAGQAALVAAVAASTKDPAITLDAMRQLVNDAVSQHVVITGEVHVGPAPATPSS